MQTENKWILAGKLKKIVPWGFGVGSGVGGWALPFGGLDREEGRDHMGDKGVGVSLGGQNEGAEPPG